MVDHISLRRRSLMPPKDLKNYKQPSRVGRVGVLLWLDRDVRTALKIAAIRNGTNVQAVLEAYAKTYGAGEEKRPTRKPKP